MSCVPLVVASGVLIGRRTPSPDDRDPEKHESDNPDERQRQGARKPPAIPGHPPVQSGSDLRRDRDVCEDGATHRVDPVRERIDLGGRREPQGQSGQREDRSREEEHRQHEELHDDLERLDLLDPAGQRETERREHEGYERHLDEQRQQQHGRVRDVHDPRQREDDHALHRCNRGPTCGLAHHDGPASGGRDQHLAEEAELPIPHDRDGREDGREEDRHGDDPREHERPEVEARSSGDEVREPGAEDEEEQDRLRERRDDPRLVPAEPDQLALPHDLHGTPVVGERAARDPDRSDVHAHRRAPMRRRMKGLLARRSAFDASESRIVRPVYDMNTSSSVGCASETERSANSVGMKRSPFGT